MTFQPPPHRTDLQKPVLDWRTQAACIDVDPNIFFVARGGTTLRAKLICNDCPVWGECLTYAIAYKEHFGIWGGLSDKQRTAIRNHLTSVDLYDFVTDSAEQGENGILPLLELTGLNKERLSRIPPMMS